MAKQITDAVLQVALRLTDQDVQRMRELEGTPNIEPGGLIPCALPLVEIIRLVIGNSIGLED
jgi:hypothetical protein